MLEVLMLVATILAAPEPAGCRLSAEGKAANARLNFEDFDQKETLPSSARTLVNKGCWSAATEATQHYLINGPLATDRQQRILLFHLAQQLANAGDEKRAVVVVAGARYPDEVLSKPTDLRWNDFVRAHWAFFAKDRPLLERALAAVKGGDGFGNRLNAALVEGLTKCFDKPYLQAVSTPCRTPPADQPQ